MNLFNDIKDLQHDAKLNLERAKTKSKEYYDARLRPRNFNAGNLVYLFNEKKSTKLGDEYTGPYKILELLPKNNVLISIRNTSRRVHIDELKLARP